VSGQEPPDLLENLRRRERLAGRARRPASGVRTLDGPTTPTMPIIPWSDAETVGVPVPALPGPRRPVGRFRRPMPADGAGQAPDARRPAAPGPEPLGPETSGPEPREVAGGGERSRSAGRAAAVEPAARRALALLLVAALAAVDGWGFARLFSVADLRPLVPVAAVAPVLLVAAASAWRRRPPPLALSMLGWVVGFVLVAAVTVEAGAGGPLARLAGVRAGVLDGPVRLLDVAVPAPGDPDLLVVPFAVCWLAAALGAELVVRTRTRLLPAAPALAGLLAATAAAVPATGSNLGPAVALTALAGLLVLARQPIAVEAGAPRVGMARTRPPSPRSPDGTAVPPAAASADGPLAPGQAVSVGRAQQPRITIASGRPPRLPAAARAIVALAVLVAAALAAGALLPGAFGTGGPVDPRAYRSTPVGQVDGLNPLSELAGWTARPDERLFTLRLAGQAAGPVPLRLAVLSDFDGASWTSSARYTRAGPIIPPSAGQPLRTGRADIGARVTQDLTVAGLTGALLPSVDRPVELGPAGDPGFAADLTDGLLLRSSPLAPGERFTVVSAPAPARSMALLAALTTGTPATAAQDTEYLALPPNVPPVLRALALVAAGQGAGPFQRAALLQHYLAANFRFDPSVPPGHSLAHVEHFVADTRRGTSEQFAATFVLAARILGLPSRLVVGFAPTAPAGPATVAVTGRQALAWAEVRFDGAGWLPFFPTPAAADREGAALAGSTQGESAAQAALVTAAVRGPLAVPAAADRPVVRAVAPSGRASQLGALLASVGTGAAVVAAGYLTVAFARPVARRRRRLSGRRGARERVVLAWEHAVDALLAVGAPIPASASPTEVVRLGSAAVGERVSDRRPRASGHGAGVSALRGLANLTELVLFGPGDRAAGLGPAAVADEARRLALVVERTAWRTASRRRRLAIRLSARAVLTRRGPSGRGR